ncbi:MAG: chromosome segregation protein ScpA [Planctomycetota bacterium]|nr:MAG: chromosome segregation protein ScpA [Planctomycetota bacterium]
MLSLRSDGFGAAGRRRRCRFAGGHPGRSGATGPPPAVPLPVGRGARTWRCARPRASGSAAASVAQDTGRSGDRAGMRDLRPEPSMHSVTVRPRFRAELGFFHGPVELLLWLVRHDEIAAERVMLRQITQQFFDASSPDAFELAAVAEFVVTMAALAEVKSRAVLPQMESAESEADEDAPELRPRADLVRRLLEYKRFKEAAALLQRRAAEWAERYPRLTDERPQQPRDASADRIRDVELWDLVSAFARLLEMQAIEEEAEIRDDDVPLHVYIEEVAERVRREGCVAFSAFFTRPFRRWAWVGRFLAILELVRHHGFRAHQPLEFGEIWILAPEYSGPLPDA